MYFQGRSWFPGQEAGPEWPYVKNVDKQSIKSKKEDKPNE